MLETPTTPIHNLPAKPELLWDPNQPSRPNLSDRHSPNRCWEERERADYIDLDVESDGSAQVEPSERVGRAVS